MSRFAFLRREWPAVFEAAAKAKAAAHADPRTACFYAPRALELGNRSHVDPLSHDLIFIQGVVGSGMSPSPVVIAIVCSIALLFHEAS